MHVVRPDSGVWVVAEVACSLVDNITSSTGKYRSRSQADAGQTCDEKLPRSISAAVCSCYAIAAAQGRAWS